MCYCRLNVNVDTQTCCQRTGGGGDESEEQRVDSINLLENFKIVNF